MHICSKFEVLPENQQQPTWEQSCRCTDYLLSPSDHASHRYKFVFSRSCNRQSIMYFFIYKQCQKISISSQQDALTYYQSNELRTKLYALATNTNPVIKYISKSNRTGGYSPQRDKWKHYAAAIQLFYWTFVCSAYLLWEIHKKQDHIKQILSYCLSICKANERYWYLSVMSKNVKNTFGDFHKK